MYVEFSFLYVCDHNNIQEFTSRHVTKIRKFNFHDKICGL